MIIRMMVLLLLLSISVCAWCHCYHYYPDQSGLKVDKNLETENTRNFKLVKINRNLNVQGTLPNSRRLENMLEKAILKIITGDLSKADMQLLKSFNYSLEEILEIRERETGSQKDEEIRRMNQIVFFQDLPYKNANSNQNWSSFLNDTFSFFRESSLKNVRIYESREEEYKEYNRQAVYDYENMVANIEFQQSQHSEFDLSFEEKSTSDNIDQSIITGSMYQNLNKNMEPYVIFKIRYDDPEFDSMSKENPMSSFTNNLSEIFQNKDHLKVKNSRNNLMDSKNSCKSFHGHNFSLYDLHSLVHHINFLKVGNSNYQGNINSAHISIDGTLSNDIKDMKITEMMLTLSNFSDTHNFSANLISNILKRQIQNSTIKNDYGDLEWRENGIYRVISEARDSVTVNYDTTNGYDQTKINCPINLHSSSEMGFDSNTRKDPFIKYPEKMNATLINFRKNKKSS